MHATLHGSAAGPRLAGRPAAARRTRHRGLRAAALAATALALPLFASACLEHEETITVHADGAVEVVHVVRGDPGDLDGGAAGAPGGPGFEVERASRTKDDGKEEATLTARARFAPGAALPSRWGGGGALDDAAALAFPTRVERVREKGGATTYRFERVYAPRRFALFQLIHDRAFPAEVRALLDDKRLEDLTDAERERVFAAALEKEREKAIAFVDAAILAHAGDAPRRIEARLAARAAIRAYFAERLTTSEVARLLADAPDVIERRAAEVERDLDRLAVERAAKELGLSAAAQKALAEGIALERRAHAVTEDLGDETFTVRVKLPGVLVDHNGDAVEDGAVVWRWKGTELRDRALTLMAVSRSE